MSGVNWQDLASHIDIWGRELGFNAVGFSGTNLTPHDEHLNRWLARDYNGDMAYMSKHGSMRSRPEALHTGTVSIISLRLDYLTKQPDPADLLDKPGMAYIARYALGRDYHKVIRNKLKKLVSKIDEYLAATDFEGFDARVFTDSAPLLEKAIAVQAGLGWIGKNTLLLNEKAGSWFFLGEILTNLPLPETAEQPVNRCGSCQACIDICPTQAITAPYELDARRCISYLTIEHRGTIPEVFRAPMGNRIFGCDDCQIVCPWNRYAQNTDENDFAPRHGLEAADLISLFSWPEEIFEQKTQGSAIRRTGYEGWLRNIAIALGNEKPDKNITAALQARKGYSDMVDEHIDWALTQQNHTEKG